MSILEDVFCAIKFSVCTCVCVHLGSKKGFNVKSYGTGSVVKLPGPSPHQPNSYDFDTTYEDMYKDLCVKDQTLYPLALPVVHPTAAHVVNRGFSLRVKGEKKRERGGE